MSQLVRGVGASRAWSTALLVVLALAGSWLPWPWPAGALGLVALGGAFAAAWLVAGARRSRRADVAGRADRLARVWPFAGIPLERPVRRTADP